MMLWGAWRPSSCRGHPAGSDSLCTDLELSLPEPRYHFCEQPSFRALPGLRDHCLLLKGTPLENYQLALEMWKTGRRAAPSLSLLFPILCSPTYSQAVVGVDKVGWRRGAGGVFRELQSTLCMVMIGWKRRKQLTSVTTQGSSWDLISHTSGSHLISAGPACLDSSRIVICFQ